MRKRRRRSIIARPAPDHLIRAAESAPRGMKKNARGTLRDARRAQRDEYAMPVAAKMMPAAPPAACHAARSTPARELRGDAGAPRFSRVAERRLNIFRPATFHVLMIFILLTPPSPASPAAQPTPRAAAQLRHAVPQSAQADKGRGSAACR